MSADVTMYYSSTCPFCKNAEELLNSKKARITIIDVDQKPDKWEEMKTLSGGRDTVPQIFINNRHIGGFDDLSELDMDDELDPLLQT